MERARDQPVYNPETNASKPSTVNCVFPRSARYAGVQGTSATWMRSMMVGLGEAGQTVVVPLLTGLVRLSPGGTGRKPRHADAVSRDWRAVTTARRTPALPARCAGALRSRCFGAPRLLGPALGPATSCESTTSRTSSSGAGQGVSRWSGTRLWEPRGDSRLSRRERGSALQPARSSMDLSRRPLETPKEPRMLLPGSGLLRELQKPRLSSSWV